jgi:hypothetical protein
MFYLTILSFVSFRKIDWHALGFSTCVKPASFGLLCAWCEVLILRQQGFHLDSSPLDMGHQRQGATNPFLSPARTSYSLDPVDLPSSIWTSSIPWPDWDAEEMMAATTLEQIPLTRCGTSSIPHQSSSPWTEMPSSSKSRESSLASARGLRWWQVVAARTDLLFLARQQRRQRRETRLDLFKRLLLGRMKNPKGFDVYL